MQNERKLAALENLESRRLLATVIVTTAADEVVPNDGAVSLREAITAINAGNDLGDADIAGQVPGVFGTNDLIRFNIPGGGVHTISLDGDLTTIRKTVTIDGYTQPGSSTNTLASGGNDAVLNIRVDGASIGAGTGSGFEFAAGADGSVLRGIMMTNIPAAVIVDATNDVVVAGNFIGTDGVNNLGGGTGVFFLATGESRIGGTTPADRNVISGNTRNIVLASDGATVTGNLIGLNAAGTTAFTGQASGITVSGSGNTIGGAAIAARNVISGNAVGISITDGGANTSILGNYIGPDVTGNAAVIGGTAIAQTGTVTGTEIGGPADGEGNVIVVRYSGSPKSAIVIDSGDARIRGNRLGTTADGTALLGGGLVGITAVSGNVTIGGASAGDRNIISGFGDGITFFSSGVVQGNFIGTDVTGKTALANGRGILVGSAAGVTIGGAAPGEGNLISGNLGDGITLGSIAVGTRVFGNRIGTDITGKLPLGNGENGVLVAGNFHAIGGMGSGEGNVIAFNGHNGVRVSLSGGPGSSNNSIFGNSIFSNTQLGIDLGEDGVTANDDDDVDTGPNGLANAPVLSSAFTNATGVAVIGKIDSRPLAGFVVQIFASPDSDPSGFGEGKLLLGTINVVADSSGIGNFSAEFPVVIPAGQVITATATMADGTSEFSNAVTVAGNPPRVSIGDVTVTEGDGVPVSATFTITLSAPISVPVTVDFTTADGTAVAPADFLAQSGSVTFDPGQTSQTVTVTVNSDSVNEGTETFALNLANATIADIGDGQAVGTILNRNVVPPPSGGTDGSIRGFTFNDNNINGVLDSGDVKISGRTVFLDSNNNGKLDSGEKSTQSAADGSYAFTGLAAGTYYVRRVFPTGYTYSNTPINIALSNGQKLIDVNIGSRATPSTPTPPPTGGTKGSISGFSFNDSNRNGILDAGETKTSGKTIFLDANNNGKLDSGEKSTKSGTDGRFSFSGLHPGTYYIRRVFPSGYTYSNTPINITLASGQVYAGANVGSRAV